MKEKEGIKVIGRARLQSFKLSFLKNFYIKLLRKLSFGRTGAQTIGQYINNFVLKHGKLLVDTGFSTNVITTVGKAAMAGLLGNTGGVTAFTYLAIGTSNTTPTAADTTLGAEIIDTGLARTIATVSRITTSTTNDTTQYTYTWTASGAKTIQEIGILNASSSGTLLAHKLTNPLTTANGNAVLATYTIQFS